MSEIDLFGASYLNYRNEIGKVKGKYHIFVESAFQPLSAAQAPLLRILQARIAETDALTFAGRPVGQRRPMAVGCLRCGDCERPS